MTREEAFKAMLNDKAIITHPTWPKTKVAKYDSERGGFFVIQVYSGKNWDDDYRKCKVDFRHAMLHDEGYTIFVVKRKLWHWRLYNTAATKYEITDDLFDEEGVDSKGRQFIGWHVTPKTRLDALGFEEV